MTPQRSKCLAFIRSFIAEHGYAPSFSEIAKGLCLRSHSNVHVLVKALAEDGKIRFRPGASRSIEIVETTPMVQMAARNVVRAFQIGQLRPDDIAYLEAALCLESAL